MSSKNTMLPMWVIFGKSFAVWLIRSKTICGYFLLERSPS